MDISCHMPGYHPGHPGNRRLEDALDIDADALTRSTRDLPDGRLDAEPRRCIGCGRLTFGSRGPTGTYWEVVCQPCKDEADAAMDRSLRALVVGLKAVEAVSRTRHACGLCHSALPFVDGRCPECDWDEYAH